MPYINGEARADLDGGYRDPETPGELNYCITRLVALYWRESGHNYASINDVLGALDGAAREFYERVARPYEQRKRVEHGDVY